MMHKWEIESVVSVALACCPSSWGVRTIRHGRMCIKGAQVTQITDMTKCVKRVRVCMYVFQRQRIYPHSKIRDLATVSDTLCVCVCVCVVMLLTVDIRSAALKTLYLKAIHIHFSHPKQPRPHKKN